MPGLSNAGLIGLSVSVVTATALTLAAVNGVFDPFFGGQPTVVAEAPPATDETPPAGAGAARQDEPAADDEPAEAITPRKKPKIDIVRVEPTGDAVIAGQSDAGALVAVLSNGVIVGKGVANETGDWAIVIEDPLKPGSHDIVIEARRQEGSEALLSDDMVAVHIPENESEGVFVATNRPGAPTEVLQAPPGQRTAMVDRVEGGKEEAADGEGQQADENVASEDRPQEQAAASEKAMAGTGQEQTEQAAAAAAAASAEAEPEAPVQVARAEPAQPAGPTATRSEPAARAEPASPVEQPTRAAETVPPAEPQEGPAANDVTEPEPETAGSEPESQPAPAPAAADETSSEPAPAPTVTAEAVAEPEPEPAPTVTAEARPEAEPQPQTQPAAEVPVETERARRPTVTVEAVEAERGQVYVAGQSTGDGAVRVYIEDRFVGEVKPNPKGQWLVTAPETIDPGQHSVRADKVEDNQGTVSARAEVVFERDPEEVALKRIAVTTSGASDVAAGADVDAGRREIPAMIIRKGDNLWRISRRHYGHGIRYTTIYQANQDQIRNPDLIYPGQVFLLPERDLNWANN